MLPIIDEYTYLVLCLIYANNKDNLCYEEC